MICPHCGKEHPDKARFCPSTGELIHPPEANREPADQQLVKMNCPHCGGLHPAGAKFCPVTGEAILRLTPPPPVSVEKVENLEELFGSISDDADAVMSEVLQPENQLEKINCPHCGGQHPLGAKFCPVTGDTLPGEVATEIVGVEIEDQPSIIETPQTEVTPGPELMNCPHCGRQHPAGAKFCPVTGNTLPAESPAKALEGIEEVAMLETPQAEVTSGPEMMNCPHCGRQHPAGAKFCPVTGNTLPAELPAKALEGIEEVTVLETPQAEAAPGPEMMNCPHCGQQHPTGAKFCPVTGERLDGTTADFEIPAYQEPAAATVVTQMEQKTAPEERMSVPAVSAGPVRAIRIDNPQCCATVIDALKRNLLVMIEMPTAFAYLAAPTNRAIGLLNEAKQSLPDKYYGSVAGDHKSLYIHTDQASIPDQFVRYHLWDLFNDAILRVPLSRVEPFKPQMVHNCTHQVLVLTDYVYQNLFSEIEVELSAWLNARAGSERVYAAALISGININGKEAPIIDQQKAMSRAAELNEMVSCVVTAPDYRKVQGQAYPIFDLSEKRVTIHRHGFTEANISNRLAEMGFAAHYASDAALVKTMRGHKIGIEQSVEEEQLQPQEATPAFQVEAVMSSQLQPLEEESMFDQRATAQWKESSGAAPLNRFKADQSVVQSGGSMNLSLKGRRINKRIMNALFGLIVLAVIVTGGVFAWQRISKSDDSQQQMAEVTPADQTLEGADAALTGEQLPQDQNEQTGIPLLVEGKGKLAYMQASSPGPNALMVLDLAGTGDSFVVNDAGGSDYYVDPDWSPDGTRIAFYTYNGSMYVFDAQPAAPSLLTKSCLGPSWSSDGSQIICRSVDQSQFDIYSVTQPGNALSSVPLTNQGVSPAWAPSANEIAYTVVENERSSIWWMPILTSGEPKMLAGESSENDAADWSPDGTQIAYQSNKSGQTEIWIMGRDGSNARQISNSAPGSWATSPTWSPDGQMLAYVSNQGGSSGQDYGEVFVIQISGGEPLQLTHTGGKIHKQSLSWGR